MKRPGVTLCVALILAGGAVSAASPALEANGGGEDPALSTSEPPRLLQQYGSVFERVSSLRADGVETEEYVLQGETRETWTQMLTYQRITAAEPMAADQYVGLLKRHLEQVPHAPRFRVVQQGRSAAIFGVHYAAHASAEEQFGIVLVSVPDERRPNELHVIQFVVNPRRLGPEELETQVKRWQTRFQSQASAFSR